MIGDAVVPVAGLGTRLLPATKSQPKEMLAVGSKPVVQHVVEELAEAGVGRVVFVTGRGKGAIENHFDADPALTDLLRRAGKEDLLARLDFERLGVRFAYVRQPRPLGLGDAVLQAEPVVRGRPFLLALGDSIVAGTGTTPLMRRLSEALEGAAAAIAVERVAVERSGSYGIVAPAGGSEPTHAGREVETSSFPLAGIVEKPIPGRAPSGWAVAGRYALGPAIFPALRRTPAGHGGELQLTDAIAGLIEAGERVVAVPLIGAERRLDTGSPAAYAAAFVELALADPEIAPALRARIEELLR